MQLMGRAAPQPEMKPHSCGRTGARRRRNAPALRRYVHGPGVDEPLVWYEGAGVADRRWLHADRQGSIIGVSNGAGAVTPYAYGPWGEPSDWTGPRFRYTGQAAFPEAQAYHYKARVYDPALGRFLQTDPIGQADDPNLYAYVKGDPVNETDPSGLAGCGTKIPGRDSANCNSTLVSADDEKHGNGRKRPDAGAKSNIFGSIARAAEASAQQDINQGERLETGEGRAEYAAQGGAGLALGVTVSAGGALLLEAGAVATTGHGALRVGAAATRGGTLGRFEVVVTRVFGQRGFQADGAAVYRRTLADGKTNVVIQNKSGEIITTFRTLSAKSLSRLSKRYGWH